MRNYIVLISVFVPVMAWAGTYVFALDTKLLPDGTHTLDAVAYDAAGNKAVSAPVTIIVDNTPPVITIKSPVDGAQVSGRVHITATSTDASPCTQRIVIDGATVATAACGPISYTWQLKKVTKGTHSIAVTATDALGNTGSKQVSVVTN